MKKALSPLTATVMLLAFAILIGIIVMNWGRDYVKVWSGIEPTPPSPESPVLQGMCGAENPLIILQTRYAKGEISTPKYLEMVAIITSTTPKEIPVNSS